MGTCTRGGEGARITGVQARVGSDVRRLDLVKQCRLFGRYVTPPIVRLPTPSFFHSTTPCAEHRDLARGTKRKFNFDTSAVERLSREAEEAALRQIERQQAEALKSKSPEFWLPSLTPTYTSGSPPTSLSDMKLHTTCHGGNPAHPIVYVVHT